ncbi:MAG: YlbF family regulator [Lachnospiraceae bacterium]|nr:YlbF family regulator [Lachnospiraceae bacterium]
MDEIKAELDKFVATLKRSELYRNYERQKKLLSQNPELKQKVDSLRQKNFHFRMGANEDQIFEESDWILREMEEVRRDPQVHEFLKAELAYCKMIQDIREYFSRAMFVDFE